MQAKAAAAAAAGAADAVATAARLSADLATPLSHLQERLRTCEADVKALQARVGGEGGGNLLQVEAELKAADEALSTADTQRTELMARKQKLDDEQHSRRSRCDPTPIFPFQQELCVCCAPILQGHWHATATLSLCKDLSTAG